MVGDLPGVLSHILALNLQRSLWCEGVENKVVVTVRTVLIAAPQSAKHGSVGTQTWVCTYLSSNSRASLRKAFLHFLQMKTISKAWRSG
jgi:hypothetical protein